MHEPLIDGVIRKMWIDRAGPYRDHLLRLDKESRRNRFGGAVSDEFIANYAELSRGLDAVMHGFFVDGIVARRRGAASARRGLRAGSRSRVLDREAVAEPRRRQRAARAHAARRAQSRHQAVAHGVPRQQRRAWSISRSKFEAELTFDFGSVVGEVEAAHPTPMSMWRELVADSHGFATAMLDVQSKMLRPA